MQKKRVLDFLVLVEQDAKGWFVAKVPDIQGCYTQGRTIAQALERVKEAIQVCLESEDLKLPQMKFVALQKVRVRV